MVFIRTIKNPITFKKIRFWEEKRQAWVSLFTDLLVGVSPNLNNFNHVAESQKNRSQLSAGSNFEKLTKILGGTIHVWSYQIRSLGIVIIRIF